MAVGIAVISRVYCMRVLGSKHPRARLSSPSICWCKPGRKELPTLPHDAMAQGGISLTRCCSTLMFSLELNFTTFDETKTVLFMSIPLGSHLVLSCCHLSAVHSGFLRRNFCFFSTTSSVIDDSDTLQPVGFESERFSNLVLSYDKQSSQAASDTLQLLKTSAEVSFSQDDIKNQGRANNQ